MKKNILNKKAFSLIELIFVIAVLAIISSIAIPKLMNLNSKANTSVIKQDINAIISSVQTYYAINNKIDKISDAISLNSQIWDIQNTQVTYKENSKDCIKLKLNTNDITLNIDISAGNICKELGDGGVQNTIYKFN